MQRRHTAAPEFALQRDRLIDGARRDHADHRHAHRIRPERRIAAHAHAHPRLPQSPLIIELLGLHEPLLAGLQLGECSPPWLAHRLGQRPDIKNQWILVARPPRIAHAQRAHGILELPAEPARAGRRPEQHQRARQTRARVTGAKGRPHHRAHGRHRVGAGRDEARPERAEPARNPQVGATTHERLGGAPAAQHEGAIHPGVCGEARRTLAARGHERHQASRQPGGLPLVEQHRGRPRDGGVGHAHHGGSGGQHRNQRLRALVKRHPGLRHHQGERIGLKLGASHRT